MNKKILFVSFSLLFLAGCFNKPQPQDDNQNQQQQTWTQTENTWTQSTWATCDSGDTCQVPLTGEQQSTIKEDAQWKITIDAQSGDDQQTVEIKKDLEKLLNE